MKQANPAFAPWLILAAVFLAYANTLPAVFQFDDYNVIVNNPAVHSWQGWLGSLGNMRPLLKLSYTVNWLLDAAPLGFHLFNVVVHALNALLVYALAQTAARGALPNENARHAALIAALLFALHPVQTEAVTYISGRSTSLMTSFYLAALLAYVHGRTRQNLHWQYLFSPLLFILAALTKEAAVTLPLILLLWDACFARERLSIKRAWLDQWPHWLILLLGLSVVAAHGGYRALPQIDLNLSTLLTQVHGIGYLLSRWFVLGGLNIDPDLRMQTVWTPLLAMQFTLLPSLIVLGLLSLRRRPWLAFGVFWLLLHLLPGNSLVVRWDIANERQLYLAGVGPFLALAIALQKSRFALPATPAKSALALLCLTLAAFTVLRNADYASEISLWQDTVSKSPSKARPYNNLGYAYQLNGDYAEARACYLRALELKPNFFLARMNLHQVEQELARSQ